MKYQRVMVALDTRCVLFLAVANAILVEIVGEDTNAELSQEEDALQQAMSLVHMLRSDYIKLIKEKQVLTDTLAALVQRMSKSQPSPTAPQLRALANESTANMENWLNSSATVVASSTFSAPQSTTRMDIPQRRFLQDESKTTTKATKNGTTQVVKKETVIKPAPIVPSKSAQKNVARKPAQPDRPTKHQAVTKHVARTSKGDFWRHLSTKTTAQTIKTKDPVLGQIARELINEFQHGNTDSLRILKQKILKSRAFKSRRDGEENAATENTEAATETNSAAEGPAPGEASPNPGDNGAADASPDNKTNLDLNNEKSTDGDQTAIGENSHHADVFTRSLNTHPDSVSLSTLNLIELWPTTHPTPTYRSSLILYLGRSSRLPTPLPKNNAFCFWEPKSPLCGLSI